MEFALDRVLRTLFIKINKSSAEKGKQGMGDQPSQIA